MSTQATVYKTYSRAGRGVILGLTVPQLAIVLVTFFPVLVSISRGAWGAGTIALLVWAFLAVMTCVPVHGRTCFGWCVAISSFALASASGLSTFVSATARGKQIDRDELDVPGALKSLQLHSAITHGDTPAKKCLIQDRARRTWTVTARAVIPGICDAPMEERHQKAAALTRLLDSCSRNNIIDGIALTVRSVPDNPHTRDSIVAAHGNPDAHPIIKHISAEMDAALTQAGVHPEGFVSVVMKEEDIAKGAREAGRKDLAGRAMIASQVMSEVENHLTAEFGCTDVAWLTVDDVAEVMQTAFAPGNADHLATARATAPEGTQPITVAPCTAGGSFAQPNVRGYRHDAWHSSSISIVLPRQGVVMGALAPVFTPSRAGEIRHATVYYAITDLVTAARKVDNAKLLNSAVGAFKDKLGMEDTATDRREKAKTEATEETVADGFTLLKPVAIVASVTVPLEWDLHQATSRLVSSTRIAGFDCIPLHAAHDVGFIASAIPVGIGLHHQTKNNWMGV